MSVVVDGDGDVNDSDAPAPAKNWLVSGCLVAVAVAVATTSVTEKNGIPGREAD